MLLHCCRVTTRTLLVPFNGPSVGPQDNTSEKAFKEMESLLKDHQFSSAIGWIISLAKEIEESVHVIESFVERFKRTFPPRTAQGWTVCAFFAEMVWFKLAFQPCKHFGSFMY